jgi:hypothetical protein
MATATPTQLFGREGDEPEVVNPDKSEVYV